jgi:hypothetical protein
MADDKVRAQLAQLAALDDATAHAVAVALNADVEIRRVAGGNVLWTTIDVQRVARMLVEHSTPSPAPLELESDIRRLVTKIPHGEG